jgi:16S rRNA G966 N2-methylase RsmD/DNA-directed RNA polymerase subunit RPC12/RpoP
MNGHDVVADYLADLASLPKSDGKPAPKNAPSAVLVPASRNSAFYTAHSYHTKVPPEAITPFIEHFTKEGDVVLDLFCGSGMTGVAAAMSGRKAILNDLSPAAAHLAWNHTNPCDPKALQTAFDELEQNVAEKLTTLYATTDANGQEAMIHWTMWSAQHKCPDCKKKFLLWDAVDKESGRLGTTIACPKCGVVLKRRDLVALDSVPAWISYKSKDGARVEKAPSASDIKKARSFSREEIKDWFPSVPLGPEREMYIRCALHLRGIKEVADFYTPRNLAALAIIWAEIHKIIDKRSRAALTFAFTNTAWHGTKMRRFNARGGQRPLTGTLYIPQLSSEVNVLEVMRNKIAQLKRYYTAYKPATESVSSVINGSATDLKGIEDCSIDYVFTDPPFGSNLFYADCNLIWESWLGRVTDASNEAVVNCSLDVASGGKTLEVYEGLMTQSMREIARVLKPGGWATVVFHSTDGDVWNALHNAAREAGFEFHDAASLDRKQQSHKGYKGRSGEEDVAHFDVVMNLRKPNAVRSISAIKSPDRRASRTLEDLIREATIDPQVKQRGTQGVHAEIVRRLASKGEDVFFDYADVRRVLESI